MPLRAGKMRADRLLAERGLAESRERAQALIMEGLVYTPAGRVLKPGTSLPDDTPLEVRGGLPYVSRGGVKLAQALSVFKLSVDGLVALDVGASTGGFTDCLLQKGASRVYAVDVGRGQLHHRLRLDPRVVLTEKCNARYAFELPEQVDIVTIDVSFISLTLIIPSVITHLKAGCQVVALVKPQFEAGREQVGRGGVVRDPKIHDQVMGRMVAWAEEQGLRVVNQCDSPILGSAGNREFFLLLQKP